jgi:hypothetical protein
MEISTEFRALMVSISQSYIVQYLQLETIHLSFLEAGWSHHLFETGNIASDFTISNRPTASQCTLPVSSLTVSVVLL